MEINEDAYIPYIKPYTSKTKRDECANAPCKKKRRTGAIKSKYCGECDTEGKLTK